MAKVRWVCRIGFVANFIRFAAVQNFENRLRFDKVTESLNVGTFFETQCTSIVNISPKMDSVTPISYVM